MGKFVWRNFRKNDTCCHTLYYLIIRSIELVVSLIRKTVVIRWKCLIIFSVHSTRQGANTCVCALTSVSLNVVPILDMCISLVKASFSLLVYHDQCSISVVCFNRSCLFVMMILPFTFFVCFAEYTRRSDRVILNLSVYTSRIQPTSSSKTNVNQGKTWEIKGKVQRKEYRQISEHATISIETVRVCTMIVYSSF